MAEYDLPGFPTYMLIAPDGRLVTLAAPRPAEFETVTAAIDALLAEKAACCGGK